ncbi:peptidoglycan DD-metalloendopeptidase family protein [Anaerobacillus sp. MEB173]|uniref:peptidoglycan DD-metalloendopeptidase family protein n=1 Tax=Anaerobacillus sp. MEB173 TaxID=3383345 RepID=UPI003F91C233
MANEAEKIRKKLAARRKEINHKVQYKQRSAPQIFQSHDEARDEPMFYVATDHDVNQEEKRNKLFKMEVFILQMSAAVCLFLVAAILFKSPAQQWEGARQFVHQTYEQEFQFAMISNWYEEQFGKPLALLPTRDQPAIPVTDDDQQVEPVYAVPASGRVAESFEKNGTGVVVETGPDSHVEAVKGGIVQYIGEYEDLGKTVIVQHYDGGESWYGKLEEINVKLYDHVKSGHHLGTVSRLDGANMGIYYFALKNGESYIDPIQVISFE